MLEDQTGPETPLTFLGAHSSAFVEQISHFLLPYDAHSSRVPDDMQRRYREQPQWKLSWERAGGFVLLLLSFMDVVFV